MKHLFVPYELALKLKEKGFDEECFGNYDCWSKKEPARLMTNIYPYFLGQEYAKRFDKTCILAPLYQQVIDWFREKHSIRSYIDQRVLDIDSPNQWVYDFVVKTGDGVTKQPFFSGDFDSYQEAQIGCINYMLKLIL